jgi:hypothetical protein
MDQKNLAELYELDPIPWSRVLEALEDQTSREARCFLATTRPDSRPHVAGVGALWDDGKVYVVRARVRGRAATSPRTRTALSRWRCRPWTWSSRAAPSG